MPEEKLYKTDISVQITKVGNFKSIIISGPDIFLNNVGTKKLYPEDIIEITDSQYKELLDGVNVVPLAEMVTKAV